MFWTLSRGAFNTCASYVQNTYLYIYMYVYTERGWTETERQRETKKAGDIERDRQTGRQTDRQTDKRDRAESLCCKRFRKRGSVSGPSHSPTLAQGIVNCVAGSLHSEGNMEKTLPSSLGKKALANLAAVAAGAPMDMRSSLGQKFLA